MMCPSVVNTGKLQEGNLVGKNLSIWMKATSFQLNSNFMTTQPSWTEFWFGTACNSTVPF